MSKLTTQEIDMFSKATEIQEMWQPEVGDTVYDLLGDGVEVVTSTFIRDGMLCIIAADYKYIATSKRICWVSSQEQLQYISFGEYNAGQFVEATIRGMWAWWVDCMHIRKECSITSMQQMWLCFVMHYKFNKVWDGADWVSVDLRSARVSPARHWIEENGE